MLRAWTDKRTGEYETTYYSLISIFILLPRSNYPHREGVMLSQAQSPPGSVFQRNVNSFSFTTKGFYWIPFLSSTSPCFVNQVFACKARYLKIKNVYIQNYKVGELQFLQSEVIFKGKKKNSWHPTQQPMVALLVDLLTVLHPSP